MDGDQPADDPPDEEPTAEDAEPEASTDSEASADQPTDPSDDDTGQPATPTEGHGADEDDLPVAAADDIDDETTDKSEDADEASPEEGDGADEGEDEDTESESPEDGDDGTADEAASDDEYEVEVPPYARVDGPSEDQEMPLAEHIEEMLKRLAVIVAVAGIVSLVTFPIAEELINFLWNSILPEGELTRPRLYGILELKLTELKVASLAGLIVALPVLVHQTYQFMRPGLYAHERRYYLAAIPTSLVLALVGVSFAYFIVLPAIFTYFLYYSQDVATIGFALGRTFDLILILMGYLAIVFQIPLFILLAMMMGLVTRQWLADRRILFWGGFLGLSFIFSPDPTGMAPIVVALTMIALFEGTLVLTRWTQGS